MGPLLIGVIASALAFGGALLGTRLRTILPRDHLEGESKDVIKLGIGLIATMTALILGLVTGSAKNTFDGADGAVRDAAVKLLALDRTLARYGPETATIRMNLKQVLGERINMIWPKDSVHANMDPTIAGRADRVEAVVDAIRLLKPNNDLQRALQARAVDLAESALQTRWLAVADTDSGVPTLFLVVLVSWLTVIFATFGMFAPSHTAIAMLFVCALSIGGALFLVLELGAPFDGWIRVSAEPLQFTYTHINR